MKVIDLLNKIANEEKLPKTVRINDVTLCLNKEKREYISIFSESNMMSYLGDDFDLNDEVKILEDTTEEIKEIQADNNYYIHTELGSFKGRKMDIAFVNKLNELTKIVNKLNSSEQK